MGSHQSKAPTQRQLRVGEEVRHALSEIFLHGKIYEPEVAGVSITVPEVRISPDLRNATAYVFPLAGQAPEGFLEALNRISPQINHMVAHKIKIKFAPRITFKIDNSFEQANRIENLFGDLDKDE